MIFDISNKKIIITGCSSGIGKFLTLELLKRNAIIIGISRKKPKIKKKNFYWYKCDLKNITEIRKKTKSITKKFKTIDSLINNAGISEEGYHEKNFKKNLQTNLFSNFFLIKEILKLMKKKGGNIVNISSICSILAFPNNPGYNSSKSALNSLSRSIALDYGKFKIRSNVLILGYFKTRMTQKSFKIKKKYLERSNRTILKRWGNLNEIIGPIIFLVSDSSSYVTGQNIIVDGGWTTKGL